MKRLFVPRLVLRDKEEVRAVLPQHTPPRAVRAEQRRHVWPEHLRRGLRGLASARAAPRWPGARSLAGRARALYVENA